jgi:hypothetical protein
MPFITANRVSNVITPIIEDPNPSNNRIYIVGQGYDLTTLANAWMYQFHFTKTDAWQTSGINNRPDNGNFPVLQGGLVGCWGATDANLNAYGINDTYHTALDFPNWPTKKALKTVNGYTILLQNTINYGSGSNNNYGYNGTLFIGPSDIGQGVFYSATTGNQSWTASHLCYEDVTNYTLWVIESQQSDRAYVSYTPNYEQSYSPTRLLGYLGANQNIRWFFLGVDLLNNTWWLRVDSNSYSQYQIYKVAGGTKASTQMMTNVTSGENTINNMCRWPSNVRRDSAARRVFYSSHFNSTSTVLTPIQFVWQADAGTISMTTCTMVYNTGTSFQTYSASCASSVGISGADCSNSLKAWQFSYGGTNYITFWPVDNSAAYGSGATRWPTAASRTMMTYSISPAPSDNILTFHSYYTFPDVYSLPRNFFPINNSQTQLAVPITGSINFFTFNNSTGWQISGNYPYEARVIGADGTGRLWMIGAERGYNSIHSIQASLPVTISVVTSATSYTFQGSNIITTALVNAYGNTGTRISSTLNLTIDGASMYFAATNARTQQVVTSASTDTVVTLVITGGGLNNIIADVNV